MTSVQETTAMAGWKLVPVEPTNDMCVAGWRKADERDAVLGNGEIAMVYRAMLAACPPPSATSSAVEALREADKALGGYFHYPAEARRADAARKLVQAALQAGTGVADGDDPVTALATQNDARTIHGAGRQAGVESELVEPVAWRVGDDGALYPTERAALEHVGGWRVQNMPCDMPVPLYSAASLSQLQQRIAEVERERDHWKAACFQEKQVVRDIVFAAGQRKDHHDIFDHLKDMRTALAASDAKLAEAVGPGGFAADRQMLFEAASDPSLSDGAVRALCIARSGEITPDVKEWALQALEARHD